MLRTDSFEYAAAKNQTEGKFSYFAIDCRRKLSPGLRWIKDFSFRRLGHVKVVSDVPITKECGRNPADPEASSNLWPQVMNDGSDWLRRSRRPELVLASMHDAPPAGSDHRSAIFFGGGGNFTLSVIWSDEICFKLGRRRQSGCGV